MTEGPMMEQLAGLLEERRRFEGWLAQLEARRATSPAHVVERVRLDYIDRLRGVTEQLRGRAAELERTAAEMASQIAALLADETRRRDERAETELRAMVGEYSEEHAHAALAGFDRAIGEVSAQRATIGAELARIQDVLASVAPPAAVAPAVLAPPPAPVELPPPASAPAPPPATAASFDELAFLQSVVKPKEVVPSPPADPSAPADYLPPPALSTVRRAGSMEEAAREANVSTATHATPDAVAAFFKDVPTEQVKTLKCGECGTMNYPTEWYCERCGGELASM